METTKLRRFAQYARRTLVAQTALKIGHVLSTDSAARRESPQAVAALIKQVEQTNLAQVIDKVAYTWFNRFCALRFMDVNGYTRIRVVSPADESQFQPEILADAKMGHMDEERVPEKTRKLVAALLSGDATSRDPQQEAYRLLVVAECNSFYKAMPYLFEQIADYTELLMPDDLLSGNSILAYTREAMTPEACKDVEVIGWLYQFYISEKKDEVFEGLKKGRKISAEDIPAATQLFTPHWIVRYLVENSLGRLWMLNHPNSSLIGQMDYYIKPADSAPAEKDFLRIQRPEDIKICDPACGSGHMLTYAFDLLYAIYEEAGTDANEIPTKILTHNLYGIELDERAGDLAAFALTMKARAKQRRFFDKAVEPNICVLEKVEFDTRELDDYMAAVGRDLFTVDLRETLQQFAEADNFGSLIRPNLSSVNDVLSLLAAKDLGGQLFLNATHEKVLKALHQAEYLCQKYQVVVANPPYMGVKGMNSALANFSKELYPESKSDLFAMFIERNLDLAVRHGAVGMITMQSWMFLSSFNNLRIRLTSAASILSMAHLGSRAFDSIGGEVVSTTAFTIDNSNNSNRVGIFLRLTDGSSESEKLSAFKNALQDDCDGLLHRVSKSEFEKIPGRPLAYWLSPGIFKAFDSKSTVGDIARAAKGLVTANNSVYVREWMEVSQNAIGYGCKSRLQAKISGRRWFPYAKGGSFRRWYGNLEAVVDWANDGQSIQNTLTEDGSRVRATNFNLDRIFKESICWTVVTAGKQSFRFVPDGFLFDAAAGVCQATSIDGKSLLAFLNSNLADIFLAAVNPTINLHPGYLEILPVNIGGDNGAISDAAKMCVELSKKDWDSFEISWDFAGSPLMHEGLVLTSIAQAIYGFFDRCKAAVVELQELEQINNKTIIEIYGLSKEIDAKVAIKEVTLICNPIYRYGTNKTENELDDLKLVDTVRDFISYAIGCMFGRYSLDKPGLILANAGDTFAEYLKQVPEPSFTPDADNVIPLLDGEWFSDDATERFRSFLRVTFGEEKYNENLRFIEEALGKDLRKYMVKDFYNDHVKRYKKRPIYWLFASTKGTFSALVYLHRYRPDTVSVVLKYLREFKEKLLARRAYLDQVTLNSNASQGEKTKAQKEIDLLKKQMLELDEYERDVLFPLASQQLALDLDDGVKVNYLKLGSALKKITGLDAKDEE